MFVYEYKILKSEFKDLDKLFILYNLKMTKLSTYTILLTV